MVLPLRAPRTAFTDAIRNMLVKETPAPQVLSVGYALLAEVTVRDTAMKLSLILMSMTELWSNRNQV